MKQRQEKQQEKKINGRHDRLIDTKKGFSKMRSDKTDHQIWQGAEDCWP